MELENIVITDIPTSRVLYGNKVTSIGHNLSREILRLRPDIQATIHVHDDSMIALLGSGAASEVKMLSLDPPYVLGKPVYYVPGHVDVEADVTGVKDFIQGTNSVVLVGHGITTLGRNVSEAYHRLEHVDGGSAAQHPGGAARRCARLAAALPQPGRARKHVSLRGVDHLPEASRKGDAGRLGCSAGDRARDHLLGHEEPLLRRAHLEPERITPGGGFSPFSSRAPCFCRKRCT
jgi:hypothetical protein